jgi:hypothetical protein
MRALRFAVAGIAAVTLIPLSATVAMASPPGNDRPTGAVDLTLGQTLTEDTTQATSGSLDAKVNRYCGAPAVNSSVWFRYTASDDNGIILDASQSDYSVGLMVFHGAPTQRSLFNCGPTAVGVRTHTGKTYTIMAFSDTAQQGGQLTLSVATAPPPPSIAVTIHSHGQAYATGNARVSGTYTCTNADFQASYGTLTQIWRRLKINGFFRFVTGGLCDGQPHRWTRTVNSDNGLYGAGEATVEIKTIACGILHCARSTASQQVTLRAPAKPSGGTSAVQPDRSVSVTCAGPSNTMWQRSRHCTNDSKNVRWSTR